MRLLHLVRQETMQLRLPLLPATVVAAGGRRPPLVEDVHWLGRGARIIRTLRVRSVPYMWEWQGMAWESGKRFLVTRRCRS